eukprot:GEZU01013938.1.p1 GENE.GEZU01013938.1~~GEZU01013938.1.p1  ORF type:complete len:186 (-),score=20.89 GEZU01013938.1:305-862(-)
MVNEDSDWNNLDILLLHGNWSHSEETMQPLLQEINRKNGCSKPKIGIEQVKEMAKTIYNKIKEEYRARCRDTTTTTINNSEDDELVATSTTPSMTPTWTQYAHKIALYDLRRAIEEIGPLFQAVNANGVICEEPYLYRILLLIVRKYLQVRYMWAHRFNWLRLYAIDCIKRDLLTELPSTWKELL